MPTLQNPEHFVLTGGKIDLPCLQEGFNPELFIDGHHSLRSATAIQARDGVGPSGYLLF